MRVSTTVIKLCEADTTVVRNACFSNHSVLLIQYHYKHFYVKYVLNSVGREHLGMLSSQVLYLTV